MPQAEMVIEVQVQTRITMLGLCVATRLAQLGWNGAMLWMVHWSINHIRVRVDKGKWERINPPISVEMNG